MSALNKIASSACARAAGVAWLLIGLSGCSNEDFALGHVTGRITCQSDPISDGMILFTPIAPTGSTLVGKPAMSKIGADGSFELTTYASHDGAVLGRHRVTVMFAGQELDDVPLIHEQNPEAGARRPRSSARKLPPCARNPQTLELEVTSAENHFDIELSN